VVVARGGFSADETVGATRGQTSGPLALIACPRPSSGGVGEGLLTTTFTLRSLLLLFSRPRREVVVAAGAVVVGEPFGVCYPAGPLVWRLFIPVGVEPEFHL
jgi:hypothetical protein